MLKSAFEHYKRQWIPLDTKQYQRPEASRWTPSALNCLKLNADCSECVDYKIYGRSWQAPQTHFKKCWMPAAVQSLLDNRSKSFTKETQLV